MTLLADLSSPTPAAVAYTVLKLVFITYICTTFIWMAFYATRQMRAGTLLANANSPAPYAAPVWFGPMILMTLLSLILAARGHPQFSLCFLVFVVATTSFLGFGDAAAREQVGLFRFSPGNLVKWTLLICGAVVFLEAQLIPLMDALLTALKIPHEDQSTVVTFRNLNSGRQILSFIFQAVIFAPFLEELFFRGFLFTYLKNHTSVITAVLLSGGIFALVHMNTAAFVPLWALGIILATTYQHTGSLLLPMCIHGCFNLITALSLLLEKNNP